MRVLVRGDRISDHLNERRLAASANQCHLAALLGTLIGCAVWSREGLSAETRTSDTEGFEVQSARQRDQRRLLTRRRGRDGGGRSAERESERRGSRACGSRFAEQPQTASLGSFKQRSHHKQSSAETWPWLRRNARTPDLPRRSPRTGGGGASAFSIWF